MATKATVTAAVAAVVITVQTFLLLILAAGLARQGEHSAGNFSNYLQLACLEAKDTS